MPDYRVRLDAAKTVLAYILGRPPEAPPTTEEPDEDEEAAAMQEALRRSPAMRAALRQALERAEAEAPRRGRPANPGNGAS